MTTPKPEIITPTIVGVLRAGLGLAGVTAKRARTTGADFTAVLMLFEALTRLDRMNDVHTDTVNKVVTWCDERGIIVRLPGEGGEPGAWYSGVSA